MIILDMTRMSIKNVRKWLGTDSARQLLTNRQIIIILHYLRYGCNKFYIKGKKEVYLYEVKEVYI